MFSPNLSSVSRRLGGRYVWERVSDIFPFRSFRGYSNKDSYRIYYCYPYRLSFSRSDILARFPLLFRFCALNLLYFHQQLCPQLLQSPSAKILSAKGVTESRPMLFFGLDKRIRLTLSFSASTSEQLSKHSQQSQAKELPEPRMYLTMKIHEGWRVVV